MWVIWISVFKNENRYLIYDIGIQSPRSWQMLTSDIRLNSSNIQYPGQISLMLDDIGESAPISTFNIGILTRQTLGSIKDMSIMLPTHLCHSGLLQALQVKKVEIELLRADIQQWKAMTYVKSSFGSTRVMCTSKSEDHIVAATLSIRPSCFLNSNNTFHSLFPRLIK